MKLSKCFLALVLSGGLIQAQDSEPKKETQPKVAKAEGFKASVLKAVKTHPSIKKLENASKVALYDIDVAEGGFLPTVDFRSSNGYENSQNATVESDDDHRRTLFRRENSLIVRQLLYDGGETSRRVERNESLYSRANFSTLDGKEALALRAVIGYLDVLRVSEQMTLSVNNIKAHKDILDIVEARLKQDLVAPSDKVQVNGRLALAEAQLRRDTADLNSAKARFKELFDMEASQLSAADDASGIPKELKEAQNITAVSHPAVLASRETIKGVDSSIKEIETRYLPRVYLELSGAKNDKLSGSKSNEEAVSAMVVFTYNFYNGGRDSNSILRELSRKDQEEEQLFETQRNLVRDVATAWYDRDGKIAEIDFFKKHQIASEETYKAYQKQYSLGKRTLFDLLNARSEYFRARFSVVDAKYTIKSSEFRILAAMGRLMKYLNE